QLESSDTPEGSVSHANRSPVFLFITPVWSIVFRMASNFGRRTMPTTSRLNKHIQTRSFARTTFVKKNKPLTAINQATMPPREKVAKIPTPVNRRKGPRQIKGRTVTLRIIPSTSASLEVFEFP